MLITALMLATATHATAADVDNEQLQTQIRRLVRQLGSSEKAQRDAAEEALIALGPQALDLVAQIPPQRDAEINTRLARVQQTLYKQAVEAAVQPRAVTLKAEMMPLSDVLAAIEKQTGNRIVDKRKQFGQAADNPKISVELAKVPFWQALDEVLDEAELTTYAFSGEKNATAIIARQLGMLPRADRAAYSGAFRFEPTQVEAIRDLRNPANQVLKLYVEVAWEPRLSPISLSQSLQSLTLTDEDGGKIEVDGRVGAIAADVNSDDAATELEIPLVLPRRSVEKIAALEGNLSVLVPGRVEKFTFENLSKLDDAQQKKASATVIVQTVRKNGSVYEVRMVLRFDKTAGALETYRGWVFANDAYLLDRDGKRVDHAGYETIRQTANEVGFAYKFVVDGGIDDYKFVYHTPAAVVQKQIPFVLKDIPLP